MKVIIAGGRDYIPTLEHEKKIVEILLSIGATEIVSGNARGADAFGEMIAKRYGIYLSTFPANWNLLGKSAGPVRNEQMADYADAVILLKGGRGTEDMRKRSIAHGLQIFEIEEHY